MVSVEKYPRFCNAGLKRFEWKDGRYFLQCKTESCTLFAPEEKYTELMEAYEMRVDQMFKPFNFPQCYCEEISSSGCPIALIILTDLTSDVRTPH